MIADNTKSNTTVDIAETAIEAICHKDGNENKEKASSKCQGFIKNAIDRYEDRRDDLDCRQKMLNAKIAIMERSIPMLMALNIRKANDGKEASDAGGGVEQVRELMKELLPPTPDPAEELLADLTTRVEQLNQETADLHDKIIKADMQLEENCIELESLELVNRELDEQIQQLQNTLDSKPSLVSLSSEDRICLAKIRELGEIKAHKKRNIQELEEKETLLRCLIEKILGPKPVRPKRLCDVMKNDSKHHMYRSKNRKKKERQKIEKSRLRVQVNKQLCGTLGCDALKKMINDNLACKCCGKQLSTQPKKKITTKDFVQTCSCRQKTAKNRGATQACICDTYLLQNSDSEDDGTQDDRLCSFL